MPFSAYRSENLSKKTKKLKKKRKHALDKDTEQGNNQEKKSFFPFFLGRFIGGERFFLFSFMNYHSGSNFTRIPYLNILGNQHKLHQKFENIFWPVRKMCR